MMKARFYIFVLALFLLGVEADDDDKKTTPADDGKKTTPASDIMSLIQKGGLPDSRRLPCSMPPVLSLDQSTCSVYCMMTFQFTGGHCNEEKVCVCKN